MEKRGTDKSCPLSTNPFFFAKAAAATAPPNATCGPNTEPKLNVPQGLLNFAAVVRNYFDKKGMHVQFNVIDRETLLDAQAHPENYKDLVVRVAGYSAHWTVLAKEVQDDIIARTEQHF